MTSRQLARLCRYWQRKLKLQDWHVSIRFAADSEMDQPDNVGECAVQLCDRTADIKILRNGQDDYELELAVV